LITHNFCPIRHALIFLAACCFFSYIEKPASAAEQNQPAADDPKKDNFRAKLGKGLSFTSDDNNFKAKLSAWMQADTAIYNSDVTPLTDGSLIRRGRIALATRFHRDWSLRAEYDFTNQNMDIRGFQDLYLRYTGVRHSAFMIGNLKEPIGLEWQTSSKNTTFMERALSTALLPPYHMGFAASTHGKSWSLKGGVFGDTLNDGISEGNGWGTTGRVTFSPAHKKSLTLHFGLSGSYRERGAQSSNLRFSSRPEANVENVRFINTDSIRNVMDYKLAGLEFAVLSGPFSVQAEYLRTFINRNRGRDDLQFDGWYAYASWFITGESRKYEPKSGKFVHVKPKHKFDLNGGWGAFEVAARYSEADLNDQRISGGRESNVTLGVNWYLNPYIRLMANYIFVQTDNNALGIKGGGREQPEIFELRAQVEF
jgi:phosphate-selective porin OprO/OprP